MIKAAGLVFVLGILGINGNPVGTCPSKNGVYVDFLTHDSDCSKFYKCDWGKPVLYDCPAGLHFNPTLNVCDWPANAGCNGASTGSTPGASTTTTPSTTTSTTTPSPGTSPSTPGGSGGCDSVSCPNIPGLHPVFHPHPNDCGRYCKCDWYGTVHDMPCPDGLHFNPTLNVCDWPASAGCNGASTGSTPGVSTTTTPASTTTPVTTTTSTTTPSPGTTTATPEDSGECGSVSCPNIPGLYPVFHPHPNDCGRYCKCDWYGRVHDMPCPDGLHFNPTLNVCDWPASAGCNGASTGSTPGVSTTTTPASTTTPVTTTTSTTTPSPGTSSTTPGDSGECRSVSCPNIPGLYPVFHPHPNNCGRYCKCDWYGRVHDMPCPDGLHFNPTKDVCDWPRDAGCV